MTVSGSAITAIQLRYSNDVLHEGRQTLMQRVVVERDALKAVEALRRGETVNWELRGVNLVIVRESLRVNP